MIDIVMAAYNGSRYIKQQIESILNNTYKEFRLFVCDDGSTDDTASIVKELQQKYKEQVFWRPNETNQGVVNNFLIGARKCSGDYIMFCDQDDVWLPDKIESTFCKMQQIEKVYGKDIPIAVFTDAKVVDGTLKVKEESFHRSSHLDTTLLDFPHMLMENKIMGCTLMINRTLKDMLFVLPKYARMHDWWIGLIASAMGKIAYLDRPTMLYRQHGSNEVGSQKFSAGKVMQQAAAIKKLKEAVRDTQKQAADFYEMYQDVLGTKEREIAHEFASLDRKNFIARRRSLFKYGFWKSGAVRNAGLFLII